MSLSDHVIELVEELDRVHPGGIADWQACEHEGLPNFVTAENGQVRVFTPFALERLGAIANLLYENDADWKSAAERSAFHGQVRICVANLHALDLLANPRSDGAQEARNRIRERLRKQRATVTATFVHHIPCWTTAALPADEFVMGPVTLRTVSDWIDWVDFQPSAYGMSTEQDREINKNWRAILKASLAAKDYESGERPPGFAGYLNSAMSKCPAVATVTITGYELALSKKVAHAVSQATLDCIGLALGNPDMFVYQILGSGRAEPFRWTSIVGIPEGLGFPGISTTRRVPSIDPVRTRARLALGRPLLTHQSLMLTSLLHPTSHTHPNLASRWLTALQWLADGHREQDDAIAIAKLGSALDTLAGGGKVRGITTMLENLFGIAKTDPFILGPRGERTLGQVVSEVYDLGRSQILHGTHYQRLKRFEELRELALLVVPRALIEAAMRLGAYTGPDSNDTAFQMMPGDSVPTSATGS